MGFSYLSQYNVAGKTAKLALDTLPAIGGKYPALILKFAGRGNDAFVGARTKAAWVQGLSPALVEKANNEIWARIFAETVVVGWEDVYEDDPSTTGCVRPATFSIETGLAFLLAIAEQKPTLFDAIVTWAMREANILGAIEIPKVKAEDLGKE